MPPSLVPEPWHSFLQELDHAVSEEVHLHCLGGFVVTQFYGLARTTVDIDTLAIAPRDQQTQVLSKGGKGSELHRKYKLYLDLVTMLSYPYNYDERLTEMFPGVYQHLRLFALDAYDLVLTKMGRNIERDREDVKYLAKVARLDLALLKQRYEVELRPYVIGNPKTYDLTLQLWIEMIEENRKTSD